MYLRTQVFETCAYAISPPRPNTPYFIKLQRLNKPEEKIKVNRLEKHAR